MLIDDSLPRKTRVYAVIVVVHKQSPSIVSPEARNRRLTRHLPLVLLSRHLSPGLPSLWPSCPAFITSDQFGLFSFVLIFPCLFLPVFVFSVNRFFFCSEHPFRSTALVFLTSLSPQRLIFALQFPLWTILYHLIMRTFAIM